MESTGIEVFSTIQILITLIIWWVLGPYIGYLIGRQRGRPVAGFWFGFLFGPLGWLVIYFGRDDRPKCPECGGVVVAGARKCKNCGSTLQAVTPPNAIIVAAPGTPSDSAETVACPRCGRTASKAVAGYFFEEGSPCCRKCAEAGSRSTATKAEPDMSVPIAGAMLVAILAFGTHIAFQELAREEADYERHMAETEEVIRDNRTLLRQLDSQKYISMQELGQSLENAPTLNPESEISMGAFEKLIDGVATVEYVKKRFSLLDHQLVSKSREGGVVTEVYRWENPDGSSMTLTFENGRLAAKKQTGLQW